MDSGKHYSSLFGNNYLWRYILLEETNPNQQEIEWVKEQVGQVYMEQKQDVEDTLIEEKYGEKKK